MRTGRPVKEETPYKIIIHRNGGRRYASTKVAIVGEDGKKQYRHKHWGSLDDDNRFHPNATYFNTAPAERAKLIFPEGWKLDGATGRGEEKRGRVEYSKDDVDRQYGTTWLLDRVAERTGIREDLLKVFGGNAEKVDQILTIAYFPFIDNLSYSHLARWQKEVKAPTDISLTSKAVTMLTQSITEQNRMDLFRLRATIADEHALARHLDMLALDIDPKERVLRSFEVNREKRDTRLTTSGFFSSKMIGLDMDALQARDNY